MKNGITLDQMASEGYSSAALSWDGKVASWGTEKIPMSLGQCDEAPDGIKEVRLLVPKRREDKWMDGALITGNPPVQRFGGHRKFVEGPIEGSRGIGLGITPDGSSLMYDPETTYSLASKRKEGSLVYGPGWTWTWINMVATDFKYLELCFDKFQNDGTVEVLEDNSPVSNPMFWGLRRMFQRESLQGDSL